MIEFEQFEQEVHNALGHLYDPTFEPSSILGIATGGETSNQAALVQTAIIEEIRRLQPAPDVPPNARASRIYLLLSYRYLQQFSQERTAELLNITPRHLRREQQTAVHVLAQRLWDQLQPAAGTESGQASQFTNWKSQIQEELASLYKRVPGSVAEVNAGVEGAMSIAQTLAARHNVQLEIRSVEPDLTANIHPSALREVLVDAVDELVRHMTGGAITLDVRRSMDRIGFVFVAHPAPVHEIQESTLSQEILKAHSGTARIERTGEALRLQIDLPTPDTSTVVVVDDNADLVHFYRRYTAQTKYQIVRVDEGPNILGRIRQASPDIIVLDIMLPDTDGWELLTHLHEHQDTRNIPVIVCSVIRHQELAQALGAALYLPKPVRRSQFLQALDRVLRQDTIA